MYILEETLQHLKSNRTVVTQYMTNCGNVEPRRMFKVYQVVHMQNLLSTMTEYSN